MQNLFTYGTLMCEEIIEAVSGCRLTFRRGTLKGFSRRAVKGEHYPAIFPNDEGAVQGILYLKVPPLAWFRLDRFEGEMYARRAVQVELDDGTILAADTYVLPPALMDSLEAFDWDYDDFLRQGKESFQRHYKGYRSLTGAKPSDIFHE